MESKLMTLNRGPQLFPRAEYLRRLDAVKAEMARREIDALVVTNQSNIAYLTGHTARSFSVPQGLVISTKWEEPIFFLRQMDVPAAIYQSFLARKNIVGYPEDLIANPARDGYDAIIDFVHDGGLSRRSLGLELGHQPPRSVQKFESRLPQANIVDFTNVVSWLRGVKSDLEIAIMREAAAITDAAILRAAEVIAPGVREADAVAEIVATLARGANGKPGTLIHTGLFLCASPRTGTGHITWTEDVFRQGSQINLELTGVRHGYTAPLMRTYSIGKPSDRLRRVHEAEVAGLEAALRAAKVGATCDDVAGAFNRTIGKHGLKKETRCGYAVGIDWTEPTASLRDGDMTVLKPNMTFHLMLGNWFEEDFGYVISETFRVTETGGEPLTSAPRKLFEI